ncbi:MAG: Rne/Rng family ribonuclease [Thermoanaerobaculia bacterium]|nr:Rne/Rng family ribonuclease [Thermoanaerobaculia bacterium]
MQKKLLVESDPYETRVAILEQDRLTELFIERHGQLGVVGNIYKGRVHRVLPGMQAAFVDIGLDRDSFLYVSEVIDPSLEDLDDPNGLRATEMEQETEEQTVDAATDGTEETRADEGEDLDATGLQDADERHAEQRRKARRDDQNGRGRSIDQLLRAGQEVVVQVLKDAMPNKGARVSTQITLPGRFLVLLPNVPHLGVSRRIEEEEERERLRNLLAEIQPEGMGLIVRTAGADADREDLESDLRYLRKLWDRIRERADKVSAPTMLHRDLDLAVRVARDYLADDFSVIWVDGEEIYERLVEFLDQSQPDLIPRVKLYRKDRGLFERFELHAEIEAALETKVWLKSGGHIVIHPTEALVAIDVNTGRYVGHRNLEDTVLTTNLEAVKEIVRQIRLRNLGGILVIDLIDMVEEEHRQRVFRALEDELAKDRAKKKVLSISEFGLVELTRKRTRPSLERVLTQPCPHCRGTGRIKSLTTIALELRGQLLAQRHRFADREVLLRVHPDVAAAMQREEQHMLREMEMEVGTSILIQSDRDLHQERFDILEV